MSPAPPKRGDAHAGRVRPIASALLTAGGWALRSRRPLLGTALVIASFGLVVRQAARGELRPPQ